MAKLKPTLNRADISLLKKSFLTRSDSDLKVIKDLVETTIDEKVEKGVLASDKSVSHLPTKDEFYQETTKILKKLDNLEIEKDVLTTQVSGHSDRLEKLETIHPQGRHQVAS